MLLLSMAVGTFDLPVVPGWSRDKGGGTTVTMPTSVGILWLSLWSRLAIDTVGVAEPLSVFLPICSSAISGLVRPCL